MSVSNYNRSIEMSYVRRVPSNVASNHHIRLRLKLFIPQQSQQAAILSQLRTQYKLSVNASCIVLEAHNQSKQLDLDLQGTIAQISKGLAYLESLNLVIKGKPNPDGDSWHY